MRALCLFIQGLENGIAQQSGCPKVFVRCFRFMRGGGSWDHHTALEMNKHTREIKGRHMSGLWFTSVHSHFLPFLQKLQASDI
jgi:hypothetical protein